MTDKEHNGWFNYETWAVNLWLSNEQASHEHWLERATHWNEQPSTSDVWTQEESAKYNLADELKEDFEENNPVADQASVWSDLMRAALSEVNWQEIAEHYINDAKEANEAN